jgi:hypothetical protein
MKVVDSKKRRFRRLHKIRMTKIKERIKRMKDFYGIYNVLFLGKEHDQWAEEKCKEQQQAFKFQSNIKTRNMTVRRWARWDTITRQRFGCDCLLIFRNPLFNAATSLYALHVHFPTFVFFLLLRLLLYISSYSF